MSVTGLRDCARPLVAGFVIAILGASLAACETYAGKGAAQGAGTGAIAGAVGGAVTALVFGGDPVEAATRSAVWGASAGAATGAIAGSQVDKQVQQQGQQQSQQPTREETEAELAKLREEIGDENFAGLEALADCKHDQSLRAAAKGRQSNNPNYALAGLWLEILNYADSGQESKARDLFPTLVEQDWNIETTAQAETKMREGTTALGNIREEYDRPRVCTT